MAEKFDEFSKHLAQKHTRRGAMKLFGASVVGAAMAAATAKTAQATPPVVNSTYPLKKIKKVLKDVPPYPSPNFNYVPSWNGKYDLHQAFKIIKQTLKAVKGY
jgi:hypothetical protein